MEKAATGKICFRPKADFGQWPIAVSVCPASSADSLELQRRQIGIRSHQPLAASAFEIYLQSRMVTAAFGAEDHAFAEAGLLSAFDPIPNIPRP